MMYDRNNIIMILHVLNVLQQVDGVDRELTVMINTTNETLTLHLKINE